MPNRRFDTLRVSWYEEPYGAISCSVGFGDRYPRAYQESLGVGLLAIPETEVALPSWECYRLAVQQFWTVNRFKYPVYTILLDFRLRKRLILR